LKRDAKKQARAAKEEAEQSTIRQRQAIKETIEAAKDEGFPDDVEEYVICNSHTQDDGNKTDDFGLTTVSDESPCEWTDADDLRRREAYFMNEVAKGEGLASDGIFK